MKNKLILIIFVLLCLTGCTLAQPDGITEKEQDALIGIYITTEHLDLFDNEKFIEENINAIMSGKDVSGGSKEYQGKLYAIETKDEFGLKKYTFESFGGMDLFVPLYEDETDSYYANSISRGISDSKMHVKTTDEGEFIELSATVYIEATAITKTFYANPVYQQSDGEVYAVTGNGMSMNYDGAGVSSTVKMEENTTQNMNGEKSGRGTKVEIKYTSIDSPTGAEVILMDKTDKETGRISINTEDIPKELNAKGAEYMIVKENGNISIYGREDENFSVFSKLNSGICMKNQINIIWE